MVRISSKPVDECLGKATDPIAETSRRPAAHCQAPTEVRSHPVSQAAAVLRPEPGSEPQTPRPNP